MKMQKDEELDEYIRECSKLAERPYKFIFKFFTKKKGRVLLTFFLWTCQRSPCWVIPLATANILDALSGADENITEIIVSKNENGKTGTAKLGWMPEYCMFGNTVDFERK